MVTATDIITYIGVPLAVLGVAPIFYTFASALYTRPKLQRVLRKNGFEPRIRARLMTGVVEVDLPVLQLYILHREESEYWLPSASPKTVGGASWSAFNFGSREVDVVTSRLQRSDNITLPEAKVGLKELLYFLQDLGCYPDLNGFHTLRTRGQNTAGTSLMCFGDSQKLGRYTILEVAKPGDRHGLISLRFVNFGRLSLGKRFDQIRNSTRVLPPFCMTGPLLELQQEDTSIETDDLASTARIPGERIKPSDANASTENRRYFVFTHVKGLRLNVVVHETPAPSKGIRLPLNHMELLNSEGHSKSSNFWRHWFACAAIAIYGFQERQYFKISPLDQQFLHTAQFLDIKVVVAINRGLIDTLETPCDVCLAYVSDNNVNLLNAIEGPEARQLIQSEDGRPRTWMSKGDLEKLVKITKLGKKHRSLATQQIQIQIHKMDLFRKHIAMPNVIRLCLRWLASNPIRLKSLSIGSFPSQPWDLEKMIQHTGDLIIRMIILDEEFAKKLKFQIDKIMTGEDISGMRPEEWLERSSQEESRYFCCAMVLLAIIGQRATYLLSGQDVTHCENEWPDVYLS